MGSVDHDAFVHRNPGAHRQLGAGHRTDADHDRPDKLGQTRCAEMQVHFVGAMHAGKVSAQLRAEDAKQRLLQCLEHPDVTPSLPRDGSHLAADESCSDHAERRAAIEQYPQRISVRQFAQVQAPCYAREPACGRTCRDAQQIPRDSAA